MLTRDTVADCLSLVVLLLLKLSEERRLAGDL